MNEKQAQLARIIRDYDAPIPDKIVTCIVSAVWALGQAENETTDLDVGTAERICMTIVEQIRKEWKACQ